MEQKLDEKMLAWDKYLQYLVEWADSHKEYVYAGASPAGFDEWYGNEYQEVLENEAQKYDLGYGYLGNGITVWNRLEEKDGDYVTVAHIGNDRSVKFYDEDLPENLRAEIEHTARTSNARISATQQDRYVFHTPPQPKQAISDEFAMSLTLPYGFTGIRAAH